MLPTVVLVRPEVQRRESTYPVEIRWHIHHTYASPGVAEDGKRRHRLVNGSEGVGEVLGVGCQSRVVGGVAHARVKVTIRCASW